MKLLLSILDDCHCDKLAHPHLFSTEKLGKFQVQHDPPPPFSSYIF